MEDRGMMCRVVLEAAQKGNFEIVTSGLSLIEVNKQPTGTAVDEDKIGAFFEHHFVLVVELGHQVGALGRDLMMRQLPGLKPADAAHVATAMIANVEALHTFDEKLLDLSGKVDCLDGRPLKICRPEIAGPLPPILEHLADTHQI